MKIPRRVLINGGLAVVIVAALVIAGIVLFKPFSATNASSTATQLTGTVQQGTVSSTISASGSIAEARDVNVNFGVSGTIASVAVAVGQTVTAGQTLGTLDTTDLPPRSTPTTPHTSTPTRICRSHAQPNAQVSQINQAKQSVSQTKNTYNAAKADLAKATLTAPIAGLVIAVNGEVGSTSGSSSNSSGSSGVRAAPGSSSSSSSSSSAFVTIADVSSYVVTTNIAEADIAKVTVGQAADDHLPRAHRHHRDRQGHGDLPDRDELELGGHLRHHDHARQDPRWSAPRPDRRGRHHDRDQRRRRALRSGGGDHHRPNGTSTVKVVDAKTKKTVVTTVTLGIVGDDGTEIKTGLTAGETIVIGTVAPTTTTGTTTGTGTRGGFGGFGGTGGFGGRTGGTGGTGGGNR